MYILCRFAQPATIANDIPPCHLKSMSKACLNICKSFCKSMLESIVLESMSLAPYAPATGQGEKVFVVDRKL